MRSVSHFRFSFFCLLGIEFLKFKISWILSRNSLLAITDITPESTVEKLLEFLTSDEATMGSGTEKKFLKTGQAPQSPRQQQAHPRFTPFVPLLKALGVTLKSNLKITETADNDLSNVLQLANNLVELLSTISESQDL